MPVIVTQLFLYWKGYDVNVGLGLWALLNIIIFHAAGNAWSDYFDFRKGVDAPDTFGSKTLTDHLLTPRQVICLASALNAIGVASGLAMVSVIGLPLLWIGIGGALCSLLYPYLKFHALGDVDIAISYALLPALGTSYVAIGQFEWQALMVVIPVGMITIAILHANNTRDIATDRRAGIATLSMALGRKASVALYAAWVICPLLCVTLYVALGILPIWSLITLLAIPIIIANITAPLVNLDERTAKLQMAFSILLSISFIL